MPASLPFGSTTAIGSLPHADAAEAVRFVRESGCDIPFWPQLPKRDFREGMVPQYAPRLPGFTVDEESRRCRVLREKATPEKLAAFYEKALEPGADFPLDEEFAAGFFAFVRAPGREEDRPAFVKGQVTGPLTFLLGLNLEDGRSVHTDEELRQAALMLLARNAAWQARALRPLAREGVVVFIDEPIYSALGTAAYLSIKAEDVRATVNEVARAAHEEGAVVGLHCCGSADWPTVLSTEIDVLSFDAWNYTDGLAVHAEAVGDFLARGGMIAPGVVPTNLEDIDSADAEAVAAKAGHVVDALSSRGIDRTQVLARAILTPSCGCGTLSFDQTAKVFDLLGKVAETWKSWAR